MPSPPRPARRRPPGPRDDAAAYVTPLVRKLATQHGVDLGSITGTGVGGRIRKQDVLDAAEAAKAPAPEPAAPAGRQRPGAAGPRCRRAPPPSPRSVAPARR